MNSRQKGLISLVVMVVLTLALVFGSESIYNALKVEPGAGGIQTTAAGFAGDVVVSTAISSEGAIEDVTIVDVSTETAEIGQAAAPQVADAIVDQQSVAVDNVSGATMTSTAVKNAVADAIAEAGFDPADYGASTESEEAAQTEVSEETTEAADKEAPAEESSEAAEEGSEVAEEGSEAAEGDVPVAYEAGTYTGTAAGFAGDVKVSVTFDENGNFSDITVDDVSTETPEVGQAAAPEVAQAILDAQSIDVDGVSGATMTSNAVIAAVVDCMEQAAGDEDAAQEDTTESGAAEEATEAPAEVDTSLGISGEFEASAAGFGGDVKVSVIIGEAGDIQGVRILDMSTETPDVGQLAAPQIAKAIVEQQTTNVDVVSGATMTSNAVMDAAALAVSGAGTPVEASAPAVAEPAEEATEAAAGPEEADDQETATETAASDESGAVDTSLGITGEYEASAPGYGGDVKVSVAIAEDGSIQSVKLLDISTESPDVGQLAAPEVAREIVIQQTTNVDVVSGATMTSNAVMDAAALAVSGAGTPVEGGADGSGEEMAAVIGGADGSTSVFVAGKTEEGESTETEEETTEAAEEPAETESAEEAIEDAADGSVFGTTEYVASAQGYGGEVKVAVVLGTDGVIYDVKILDCSTETEDKGQVAAPQIAEAIVLANSTDVDAVSGATETSNAVIEAVESVLASE